MSAARLALSPDDRERLAAVDGVAAAGPGAVVQLIERLDDPSWAVRRAVVAALARAGDAVVAPLIEALRDRRETEARIAATVDALAASDGAPEDGLLALGRRARPQVLCDVIVILGRRRCRRCADVIAGWTRHPDDNVAVCAIEALGNMGAAAGLEAIVEAAATGSSYRVFPAIDVLARTPDPRALPPLVRLLADPVWGLEAARALGRRGEDDAVPALIGLLGARADATVRVAATALSEIAERQRERFGASADVSERLRAVDDPAALARRLASSVPGGDAEERSALARLLGWQADPVAAATLVDLLGDEPRIAREAARALAELGPVAEREILAALARGDSGRRRVLLPLVPSRPDVADVVVACLDDDDPEVRALACEVLARAGGVSAVPRLFGALDDDDPRVAHAAVGALQGLGHAETEPLALAAARSPHPAVRRAALGLLGYFGWPSGLEPLVEALGSDDERVRDTALSSLAWLEDPRALDALLATARGPTPSARAAAMRALGDTSRAPEVVAVLEAGTADPEPWVRYFACQSLGRLGAVGSIDALVARLGDGAGQVRVAVIEALARLPDPRATRSLLDAARAGDPDLRRAALLGLAIAQPREALPVVLEAVHDPEPMTRVVALSALGGQADPGVDLVLAEAARSDDEVVRTAAVGALAARPGVGSTLALVDLLDLSPPPPGVLDALATWVTGRVPGLLAGLETADEARTQALVAALARMRRSEAVGGLLVALSMERVVARRAAATAFAALGAGVARLLLERAAAEDPDLEVRRLALHALSRR